MDKRIIIVFLIIIIAIISAVIFNKSKEVEETENQIPTPVPIVNQEPPKEEEKTVEVTDEMIEKIKEESYLNILLQIQSFDSLYANYEPLLEAAMRIASAQELVEVQMDGIYLEYVPRTVIHDIIFELSGMRIEEPIVIDDFYYLYDEEGDYYYIVPIGVSWLELEEINSITYSKKDDQYIVKCSGSQGTEESGLITHYPNAEVRIKYKPNNKYVKYQLISVSVGKSNVEVTE